MNNLDDVSPIQDVVSLSLNTPIALKLQDILPGVPLYTWLTSVEQRDTGELVLKFGRPDPLSSVNAGQESFEDELN